MSLAENSSKLNEILQTLINADFSKPNKVTEGIIYELSEDNTYAMAVGYDGTDYNVLIADEYQGKRVTTISNYAFKEKFIESITIPNSVKILGEEAFAGCYNLQNVTLSDYLQELGASVFVDCRELKTIKLPYFTVSSGIYKIPTYAFSNCLNLETVDMYGVTEIEGGAFMFCSKLTDIYINSVHVFGEMAFGFCNGLTNLQMNLATSIKAGAFSYCGGLTDVSIGDNIINIEAEAFKNSSIKRLTVLSETPPTIQTSTFQGTDIEVIYVPQQSVDAYKQKTNWSNFADKIVGI